MNAIFITIIAIPIVLILLHKIHIIKDAYDTLDKNHSITKEKLKFYENEIERYKEQIRVYERNEENNDYVIINCKKVKKNNLFKGKRALVGDYIESSSDITIKLLQSFGMIVDIVRSGEDIVDKIKHGYECDIIFTNNVYRNGGSGPSTLSKLKEIKDFDIPVVIHTISDNERKYFIDDCGFDEYIVKPLNQKKLKPILDKLLNSR